MPVNTAGHLEIGGIDLYELSRGSEFPIYILDEATVRQNMQSYLDALKAYWPGKFEVHYACKALCTLAICKIAEEEGLGLDVASGGELFTAIKAKFPTERIILHGNNKSSREIDMALDAGVGRIVIDSLEEIDLIESRCQIFQKKIDVLVRLQPGVFLTTHPHLNTSSRNSKFGLSLEQDNALHALLRLAKKRFLSFRGIHFHIGSQLTNLDAHRLSLAAIADFIIALQKEGLHTAELDIGGGLGLPAEHLSSAQSIRAFVHDLSQFASEIFAERNLDYPTLLLEPGRSIVAEAGTTLYTIGAVKEMPDGSICAAVNGGMGDNIRPCLYGATYKAVLANKAAEPATSRVKLVGKFCEAGDVLIENIALPLPERGDVVALLTTGAYHYSMASNYNRIPIPGMLLLHDGKADWIVKPQSYEQMPQGDMLPEHLCS